LSARSLAEATAREYDCLRRRIQVLESTESLGLPLQLLAGRASSHIATSKYSPRTATTFMHELYERPLLPTQAVDFSLGSAGVDADFAPFFFAVKCRWPVKIGGRPTFLKIADAGKFCSNVGARKSINAKGNPGIDQESGITAKNMT
jgi:hypothetical protein